MLVTRPTDQAASLQAALGAAGAAPIAYPTIEVAPPPSWDAFDRAIAGAAAYGWVVLTSPSAVQARRGRARRGRLAGAGGGAVAAAAPATAGALAGEGLAAEVIPADDEQRQEGLAAALGTSPAGTRAVPAGSRRARAPTPAARGARPDRRRGRRLADDTDRRLAAAPAFDAATFASPSALRAFLARWTAAPLARAPLAVIGPTTAEAARAAGLGTRPSRQPHARSARGGAPLVARAPLTSAFAVSAVPAAG